MTRICHTLRTKIATAFLLLWLAMTAGAQEAAWPQPPKVATPSSADMARLEAGEVLVQNTQLDKAGGAAVAQAIFYTDAPELWRVLGDCEANYRFVRGLRECEILRQDASYALTRQTLKPYVLFPRFDYVFETLREPYDWILIRLREGDLRALEGSWRFDPAPGGGLLVTHMIRIQPRIMVPRWLARQTVERDLYALIACLRWETKAWPDPRQRGLDREQCPD